MELGLRYESYRDRLGIDALNFNWSYMIYELILFCLNSPFVFH